MTYLNAKKYLLGAKQKKSDGAAFSQMLTALGNPAKRLRYMKFLGSNGKSVCAEMLCSVLIQAQYRVGCLRLPLREEPRENITVDGKALSMDTFSLLVETIRTTAAEEKISLAPSEILLCVALLALRECNICIIECDSDFAEPIKQLPPPLASVICGTVSSEDKALLSKLPAYICKGTGEVVCSPQNNASYRAISDACYAASCRLTLPARGALNVGRLTYRSSEFTYKDNTYSLGLCGSFQIANAVLVIECAEMLARKGLKISREHIQNGLAKLKIPAKLEVISISPLIIIDSTHDTVGAQTVCDALCDFKPLSGNTLRLCLPEDSLCEIFSSAFSARDYQIEKILTPMCAESTSLSPKQLARIVLSDLDRNTILFVSGDYPFVSKLRYEILAVLGF